MPCLCGDTAFFLKQFKLSNIMSLIEKGKTKRGFFFAEFTDRYGEKCSLQKSSLAFEDCIWLGIEKPKLIVFENEDKGKYIETVIPETWSVTARMHLTRELAAELIPYLQKFVKTGDL